MPERRAVFSTHFLADLGYWVRTDRKVALRLLRIVGETLARAVNVEGQIDAAH